VTATFVYDGDCSFCTTCAEFIERRIPTHARIIPWQFADHRHLLPGGTAACSLPQAQRDLLFGENH